MQFGWSADESTSHSILDTYAAQGGNFIDTADCYSSWASNMGGLRNEGGVAEAIVGRWLTSQNRYDIILATKVRAAMGEHFADNRSTFKQREGLSRRWIIQSCEDSLRRLQTDYIDLYQAHFIDPLIPIEETLSVFTDLVRQGKVRYLGCSNYSAWRLMQALWTSEVKGLESFVSLQPEYNLLAPTRGDFETELAQVCEHYKIGVTPYSPLAGGVLSGKYRRGQALPASVRATENAEKRLTEQHVSEKNWHIIETLATIAEKNQLTSAQVAINWLRSQPCVTAPIIGANSATQLQGVLDGLNTTLSDDDLAILSQASDFYRPRTHLET
ncbi:aldo/keto reductase [Marinomonas agarivorans]|nr:aldo/keto reductase [Marinomonas agarivorans]